MSPAAQASERQRKAAYKAWETIRRKQAQAQIANAGAKPDAKPKVKPPRTRKKGMILPDYPANWKEIRLKIRNRSRNSNGGEQCECRGECLKHHGRCEEINGTWARYRRSKGKVKIRFTIAHLCHRVESLDPQKWRALKTKDMRNRASIALGTAFIDFRGPKALNDTPRCDDGSHLRAMCEPCHLIYDLRCRQRALCGEDAVKWALQQGQN